MVLKSEGMSNEAIADKLDITVPTVHLCLDKFSVSGIRAALEDSPGYGRKPEIFDDSKAWVLNIACQNPSAFGLSAALWYPVSLTKYVNSIAEQEGSPRMANASVFSIRKILREAMLNPHKVTYYCEKREYLNTIPGRFEFVFTPTHGSWLNMVDTIDSVRGNMRLKQVNKRRQGWPRKIVENPEFPADVVKNWMRSRSTIEFLGLWEQLYNPNFKLVEFDQFKSEAGLNAFVLSPQKWISSTDAIGIISKSGRYGGTFAHKDIAFEFASWISPEFKLYIIKDYQQLKIDESKRLKIGWDTNPKIG